jgi:hypothetical protein
LLHVEARHVIVRVAHLNGRDACIRRVSWNIAKHHGTCANLCAIADVDISEQLSVRTEHHAIPDFRVTVADFVTGTAQGHAMQKAHVVPDGRGFTDDDICGVVHQKSVANLCCRVDVHTELAADDALEHFGGEVAAFFIKDMGYAVGLQSLETLEEQ